MAERSQDKEVSQWLVLFDDGDKDSIILPDQKGEVRIVSSKRNCNPEKEAQSQTGKRRQSDHTERATSPSDGPFPTASMIQSSPAVSSYHGNLTQPTK